MIGQATFNDLYGEEFDFFKSPPVKEKKTEKKAATKKKAETKKTEKPLNVTMPCKVYGQYFTKEIPKADESETLISSAELIKRLIDAGIDEAAVNCKAIFIPEDLSSVAYLVEHHEITPSGDTLIVFGQSGVTFAFGEKKAIYTAEDFAGKECDEICLDDAKEKIFEAYPAFSKSELFYDVEAGVIVPFLGTRASERETSTVKYPVTVNICGEERTLEENPSGETVKDLVSYLTKDFETKNLKVGLHKLEDGIYYTSFSASGNTAKNTEKKNKGAKTSKKEEKFPVEGTTIYLVFNGHKEAVNKECFGGKEKITKNDVIEYFKPRFAVFSSSEKVGNINCSYDETYKCLSVDCTPGRRGAKSASFSFSGADVPIIDDKELTSYLASPAATCYKQIGQRCHTNRGDLLYANMTGAYFVQTDGTLLKYQRKTEKPPGAVFDRMVRYFQSKLPYEAICRIIYNAHGDGFSVLLPTKVFATKTTVEQAVFPMIPPYCEVFATFHSHNTMPAFFSSTDDLAEMDQIGIFGVLGQLNQSHIDAKVRAMFQGSCINLEIGELFDLSSSEVAA